MEIVERLTARSSMDECWTWQGLLDEDGYGRITVDKHSRSTHRVAYIALVGPIAEGLTLDHLCRNRACWNPAHLEPVTNRENILRGDGWSGLNARKTHCPMGHEYTPENIRVRPDRPGERECRKCRRAAERRRKKRREAEYRAWRDR